jgi:hypothetical protein
VPAAACQSDLASVRARALPAQSLGWLGGGREAPLRLGISEGAVTSAPSDGTNDHVTGEVL